MIQCTILKDLMLNYKNVCIKLNSKHWNKHRSAFRLVPNIDSHAVLPGRCQSNQRVVRIDVEVSNRVITLKEMR